MPALSNAQVESIDSADAAKIAKDIYACLRSVVHGPDEALLYSIVCLFAEGHILLEDMPGTGKTTMAKALAISTSLFANRIQFTPDLVTKEVIGYRSFENDRYELIRGPIFANIVVADELNRAAPRTQATMLECMEEGKVSLGAVTYEIERPFLIFATQNPVAQEGTYVLPEAQMDRFMMRLTLGYPSRESARKILIGHSGPNPLDSLKPVTTSEDIRRVIAQARRVLISEAVADYAIDLIEATRADERVAVGASPRAGVSLMRAVKAWALIAGRDYATVADVRRLAAPLLAHRLSFKDKDGVEALRVTEEIVAGVPLPAHEEDGPARESKAGARDRSESALLRGAVVPVAAM